MSWHSVAGILQDLRVSFSKAIQKPTSGLEKLPKPGWPRLSTRWAISRKLASEPQPTWRMPSDGTGELLVSLPLREISFNDQSDLSQHKISPKHEIAWKTSAKVGQRNVRSVFLGPM